MLAYLFRYDKFMIEEIVVRRYGKSVGKTGLLRR
jgi:hypothetical protein